DVSQPPISLTINDVTVTEGNSGTTNAVFTVSLSSAASTVVSVDYATANGTATAGTDYTAIPPTTLTFNPGETSKTITVAVNGDNQVELNETFFLNLSNLQTNGSNVTLADNQGQGTITNDDERPKITIAPGINPVEGGTVGTFIISLDTPAPTGGIVVNFNTTGSTATNIADYSLTAGTNITAVTANTFTIAAGATTATLNVVALSDAVNDPNETVKVNLTSGGDYILGANSSASFNPATNFSVGNRPTSVTVGDFNGDGKSDLAVANYFGSNVSVLLGTGTGSFGPATNFSVGMGSYPNSVTVGDFNGDGKSDLATANISGSNVSALLGTGTGSFGTATNFSVGIFPRSVTVGDFNGDGKSDLATANIFGNNVSVLLGTGTGSFGPATNFSVGINPLSVTVGDFNGDGKSDLATANAGSNNVSVLLGTGTGSFGTPTNFSVGTNPHSVTVGDFNGDGQSDLAVANNSTDNVSVLLGTGTGSFGPATNFSVGNEPLSVTVGDFNGDGKSDLAVANGNSNNVSVLLGTGTGSFGTATNFSVGAGPWSVTVGDFNGDGKSDLATANRYGNNVSVLLNADPTPTTATVTITDVSQPPISLNGTATAGTDYTALPTTTLTFNPGETSKTITVPVNGDNQVELNETFLLNLSNLQANGSNVTLADNQGQGTINNDDSASIAISDVTITEGNSGTTNAVFTVTLSNAVDTAVTVNYATADGTATTTDNDYTAIATTPLIFNAGETSKTITVAVNGDNQVESNETFFVNLSNLQANGRNVTITDNQGQGTITDDDVILPSITLAVAPSSVTEDGTSNLIYTFTRSGVTSNALTVNYSIGGTANNGTDYASIPTGVTFAANLATATVTINPTADTTVESDETVALTLTAGTDYTIGTTTAVTGTITNDDTSVTLAVSPASVTEDGTSNLVYTFTRTGVTSNALTANYTVGGTATFSTDYTQTGAASYTATTGTVNFAAGSATATVTVDPTADTTVESNETVALTLASGTGYTVGTTTAV
ncbi:MAG: hypothetical protein GPI92_24060, partial [Microcystis aeruginosa K13-06]|nr:hypothetical protein [Microcystis aeruginosa K13-06]